MSNNRYDRNDIRLMNAASVLKLIRQDGAISRANIASRLGLTRATISNIVSDLIEINLVREFRQQKSNYVGRPGILLDINSEAGALVAIALDVDQIKIVVSDFNLNKLWSLHEFIDVSLDSVVLFQKISDFVEQAVTYAADRKLRLYGLCVAWSGLVDRNQRILVYGPSSGLKDIHIGAQWETRFKLPVFLENEAHVGAIAAHYRNQNSSVRNMIYLSVGVGLAAGIYVDDSLLRGAHGFAGQVGHTPFRDNGLQCVCGKTGCWVTEVGAHAIRRKLDSTGLGYVLKSHDWVQRTLQLAEEGDSTVLRILDDVAHKIGEGLAQLVQSFNPSIVIVGGSAGILFRFSKNALLEGVQARVMSSFGESLKLVIMDSPDDRLYGCSVVVRESVLKRPPIR
jgi:predicted NBD/HSP70 family sugar kinase